jgi:ferric-dicitrate binding protein FerR (iron transport regulator)
MSAEQRLDAAFEKFLKERRDHREGLTARQQLWTAFEAGAKFSLAEIARDLPARNESERESGRRAGE